jgi:hypothetical protein
MEKSNLEPRSRQSWHLLYPPLNDREAAKYLGIAVQTLRNWRHLRKGPAYLKLSPGPRGRIGYLIKDLNEYRNRCRIEPEAV